MTQNGNGFNYSYNFNPQPINRPRHVAFSPKELKHVAVAALLVIGIGFSIGFYGNFFGGFRFYWTYDLMAVFAVIMTASFLIHEFAHKIAAQKKGLWAEFRLTTWGALLTFASVFLPFRMISPGAMMIAGSTDKDGMLKISIAGVITNLTLSSILFASAFFLPISLPYAYMLLFAAYVNAFMAVFNLLPFGILDGYKIFSLNKKVWVAAFIPSVILAIMSYLYI